MCHFKERWSCWRILHCMCVCFLSPMSNSIYLTNLFEWKVSEVYKNDFKSWKLIYKWHNFSKVYLYNKRNMVFYLQLKYMGGKNRLIMLSRILKWKLGRLFKYVQPKENGQILSTLTSTDVRWVRRGDGMSWHEDRIGAVERRPFVMCEGNLHPCQ